MRTLLPPPDDNAEFDALWTDVGCRLDGLLIEVAANAKAAGLGPRDYIAATVLNLMWDCALLCREYGIDYEHFLNLAGDVWENSK